MDHESKNKEETKANRRMFYMSLFMFFLSTLYWASSVANLIVTIHVFLLSDKNPTRSIAFSLFPLLNAIITINVRLSRDSSYLLAYPRFSLVFPK